MQRIKITLDEKEYEALVRLSDREMRSLSEQARAVIHERLKRAKLLQKTAQMEEE